ncbi:fimbrillin family protein [Bacteroides faecichinchillae]|uniref:fimbrillin family protein n=1 Tax=Bacteroides faecichinchillae TaxID=871325 RepID=UPI003519D7BC
MKKQQYQYIAAYILSVLMFISCHDNEIVKDDSLNGTSNIISLSGEIDQVVVTRVNDNGFCDGDVMDVYVVDYKGNTPGKLENSGNWGDNVRHTFDETAYKWNSAYDIYWKDDKTHIDIYGYYPVGTPSEVNAYEFEVQKDQAKTSGDGELGGYEASDFLWGKATDVAPTEKVIRLPMRHKMSNARITLVEGEGFTEGTWTKLEKQVLVLNTKRNSVIDLATGNVTATKEVAKTGIIPFCKDNEFRAIVVPQIIEAGKILFSITVDGVPYTFKKNEAFIYVAGKMHNFTIKVDKKEASGKYEFILIDESITAWENDQASHEATAKDYTGKTENSHYALLAGGLHRIAGDFCIYEEIGYGVRTVIWETNEGNYLRNTNYSSKGIAAELGAMLRLQRFVFSAGTITTRGNY